MTLTKWKDGCGGCIFNRDLLRNRGATSDFFLVFLAIFLLSNLSQQWKNFDWSLEKLFLSKKSLVILILNRGLRSGKGFSVLFFIPSAVFPCVLILPIAVVNKCGHFQKKEQNRNELHPGLIIILQYFLKMYNFCKSRVKSRLGTFCCDLH